MMTSETEQTAYVEALVRRTRRPLDRHEVAELKAVAQFSVSDTGDGLRTFVLPDHVVSDDVANVIYGFRLGEFLSLGLMSAELAHERRMRIEPRDETTSHAVCLGPDDRMVGYLALVSTTDPHPLPLDAAHRNRFPVESAHHIDLLSRFATPHVHTDQVQEIKRFVRVGDLAPSLMSDRVPWHLIVALGRSVLAGRARLLIGDSREDGALRHFRLLGFDPVVVSHSAPSLPHSSLMWPSYELATTARPFAGWIPTSLTATIDVIDRSLRQSANGNWQRLLVRELMAVSHEFA